MLPILATLSVMIGAALVAAIGAVALEVRWWWQRSVSGWQREEADGG